MCKYAYAICHLRDKLQQDDSVTVWNDKAFDFGPEEIKLLRENFKKLIDNLIPMYQKTKRPIEVEVGLEDDIDELTPQAVGSGQPNPNSGKVTVDTQDECLKLLTGLSFKQNQCLKDRTNVRSKLAKPGNHIAYNIGSLEQLK